ncbi:MAG: ribosome biogenesis GTP-binding protein YihA/YsxC [Vallitaleaceae bacterium]|jgi:GTP-binding protein|nr:ribosome biogenesis GTP-binding protein YihA/YsxC [Vallitaleaceae bacterium]
MNINNVYLDKVGTQMHQYPENNLPEIAFAGKSNVGKSSMINGLINRKKLARTSGQPGKTQTINFYNIDEKAYFVDLPGYGYAKVSKTSRDKWGQMIDTYLHLRESLVQVVVLVDIRHKPSENDQIMVNWVRSCGYEPLIVATKADKLTKNQTIKQCGIIIKVLNIADVRMIVPFSAVTKVGKEQILAVVGKLLNEEIIGAN